MDTQETTPRTSANKTERTLVFKVSEDDYRRYCVGRAKLGLKVSEYLSHLLDLDKAQNTIE